MYMYMYLQAIPMYNGADGLYQSSTWNVNNAIGIELDGHTLSYKVPNTLS